MGEPRPIFAAGDTTFQHVAGPTCACGPIQEPGGTFVHLSMDKDDWAAAPVDGEG